MREIRHVRYRPRSRSVGVALAGAVALAGILAGCGGSEDGADAGGTTTEIVVAGEIGTAAAAPGLVTPEQAAALAADDSVTVLDVRTPQEFQEGHLDGAVDIDFEGPDFAGQIAELDPGQPYLVYCRSGNRSAAATEEMRAAGFDQVYEIDGGVIDWEAAGLPLTTD
ncbi:MAG: rhodanese-like domain-containing protein [Acidimicrobiales bacterium]